MSAGTLECATAAVTDPELQAIAHDLAARARRYERARDSRCVFTHAYATLTTRLASQLGGAGFRDPEFILAVGRGFHQRYAMALDAWDRGSDVPETWRYVFGEMTGRRTSPLEDLVLGVYTHIVHDLTLVLADLARRGASDRSATSIWRTRSSPRPSRGSSARSVGATARGSPGSTGSAVSSTSC
jgi:Family of unknown function (DUF5995)